METVIPVCIIFLQLIEKLILIEEHNTVEMKNKITRMPRNFLKYKNVVILDDINILLIVLSRCSRPIPFLKVIVKSLDTQKSIVGMYQDRSLLITILAKYPLSFAVKKTGFGT